MDDSYSEVMQLFEDPVVEKRKREREMAMAELRLNLQRRREEAPRHRTPDHATSIAGAQEVGKRVPSQQVRLLQAFAWAGHRGFTDEQAAHKAGLTHVCYWRRCTDLRHRGWISQPEGNPVRKGTAGVDRIISTITVAGTEHLRSLRSQA